MAGGERIVTQLGLDANELLAGLDGVAQAYEEAGGKLLKTVSVIDRVNDANERLSRTVKVLTDNGKLLTFVATTNAEGMTNLTTSIETSEKSVRDLIKAYKDLASANTKDKERVEAATAASAAQAKLNQVLGETIDLTKFGVAAAQDQSKAVKAVEEANKKAEQSLKSLASTKSPFDVEKLTQFVRKQEEAFQAEKRARDDRAKALSSSLSSGANPFDANKLSEYATAQQKIWDAQKKADEQRKTDFSKLKQDQSAFNAGLLAQYENERKIREEATKTAEIKEKTSFTNKQLYKESAFDVNKIVEANKANDEAHKRWITSLQTIESGYKRIGETLSSEDFTKAVNELHAQDARGLLSSSFSAAPGLNKAQLLDLQRQIQTASRSVLSGAVSPQEFQQIVQHIQNGTLNLKGMSTAAVQAANAITAVKNAAAGVPPQAVQMFLSFQSLVRILQVQLLHTFFGELSRGIQSSIADAVQLEVRISEIKTITQGAKTSSDAWITSLRGISDAFGLDILDVAEGAYEAISNQIVDATTAMGFLGEASEFARATVSTLGQSVNLLSSILNAFNLNALETEQVAATLFKTIELGRVRAEDMADTIGATARLASQAGVTFQEFAASISVATIQGVRFDAANTLMRNVLLKLLKPTDEMQNLFRQWGVESGEAAIATFSFAGVLQKLAEEIDKGGIGRLAESLQELRAIQGVVTLAGGNFEESYAATLDKLGGSAKSAAQAMAEYAEAKRLTQDESPGFKFQKQQQQFKNIFVVDFGDKFLRELVKLSEQTGDLTNNLKLVADSMIAFIRPMIEATAIVVNLTQYLGYLTLGFGKGSDGAIRFAGALGGAASALTLITFVNTIRGLFGVVTAMSAATTASNGLRAAFIALGLSNPWIAGLTIATAALGAFYANYAATQDKIRTIDADVKNDFLKSIEEVQGAREAAALAELNLARRTLDEKFRSHNQALVPVTKEFNAAITEAVTGTDDLIARLEGLPTLAALLGTKGEDLNLSAEAIAETFDKLIKKVAKDIEKSLDLSDKLKIGADKQNFKESLIGLNETQAIDAYIKKYEELHAKAKEAGQTDKNGLVKDAEAAREYFGEANDMLEEISSKRFDLFKETKKSIEESLKLTKKLTETFEEKQFERSIEGKSDRTQSAAYAKRARLAQEEGRKLAESGDFEGARAKFELADNFFDSSIDKANAINKKKKGRGRSSGTQGLLAETEALYNERLALEEKFRKEQEAKQEQDKQGNKAVQDERNKLLDEQLALEERYRKGLDDQLKAQKAIVDETKSYKEALEANLALQKQITEELNRQAGLKADKEKERTGALTDFYGAASQYAAGHSLTNVRSGNAEQAEVGRALGEIPALIEQAKKIENDLTLSDHERRKQVNANRIEIQQRINVARDYNTRHGIDSSQRRIGDHTEKDLENRIDSTSEKAIRATAGVITAEAEYNKLTASLDQIKAASIKASEAKNEETDLVKKLSENVKQLNEHIEARNKKIQEENAKLPDEKKRPLFETIPAFASGGLLGGPSPSGPGDNQLIFARTGEFIMNERSTRKFYSQLVAMNNGHYPRGYAKGGQVTNNLGGININVPEGTPAQSAREIASQLRRGLRNKTLSLN